MAEDKVEPREINWRQLMPWTVLFQGFRVALDPNKLVLAAAGILLMAFGWWLLSIIFDYSKPVPSDPKYASSNYEKEGRDEADRDKAAWDAFRKDRIKWNLQHAASGKPDADERWEAEDFAKSPAEVKGLKALAKEAVLPPDVRTNADVEQMVRDGRLTEEQATVYKVALSQKKPSGRLRAWPWEENRGPNPALLVTGQAGPQWDKGHFWDWLLTDQLPVLIEPLVKLFLPVRFFFGTGAGPWLCFYSLLVMLWSLLVWGFFGGAITRIAVVQVARQEKIGLMEAVRFAARKYLSYLSAPLFPLALVGILLVFMVLFGYLHMIPLFGDVIIDGLLWGLMILIGLAMAVVLVGLVGWPLMAATISAEGTDAGEAVSRSYSYVYQAAWHYIFYSLVALLYGAAIIFFVGLMGSLTVFLSKWGVSKTPLLETANRDPSYLFAYAPESFGWRELLLQGTTVEGMNLVENGTINPDAYKRYLDTFKWYNHVGAVMVSVVWVGAIFMLVLGFGYSYFWSASSIIYLLMRRKVDDAELDEVYLEEEDDAAYTGPLAAKPAAPAAPPAPPLPPTATRPSLPIVEAPPPRPTAATVPPPTPPPPAPAPAAPARDEIAGAIHAAPPPSPITPEPPPPDEHGNTPGGA